MTCTCAGTAPGYPQHESGCGQPEPEWTDDDDWMGAVMADAPTLHSVTLTVCSLCLAGRGGVCWVPGCWYWACDAPTAESAQVMRDLQPPSGVSA